MNAKDLERVEKVSSCRRLAVRTFARGLMEKSVHFNSSAFSLIFSTAVTMSSMSSCVPSNVD